MQFKGSDYNFVVEKRKRDLYIGKKGGKKS